MFPTWFSIPWDLKYESYYIICFEPILSQMKCTYCVMINNAQYENHIVYTTCIVQKTKSYGMAFVNFNKFNLLILGSKPLNSLKTPSYPFLKSSNFRVIEKRKFRASSSLLGASCSVSLNVGCSSLSLVLINRNQRYLLLHLFSFSALHYSSFSVFYFSTLPLSVFFFLSFSSFSSSLLLLYAPMSLCYCCLLSPASLPLPCFLPLSQIEHMLTIGTNIVDLLWECWKALF